MERSAVRYFRSQAACLRRHFDGYREAAVFAGLNGSKTDQFLNVAGKQRPRPRTGVQRDGGVAEKSMNVAGVANEETLRIACR